jgi:hypothetical protein
MHRLKLATKLAEDTKEDQIFHGMASRYSPDPAKKYILSILAAPTAITVDLKVFYMAIIIN